MDHNGIDMYTTLPGREGYGGVDLQDGGLGVWECKECWGVD